MTGLEIEALVLIVFSVSKLFGGSTSEDGVFTFVTLEGTNEELSGKCSFNDSSSGGCWSSDTEGGVTSTVNGNFGVVALKKDLKFTGSSDSISTSVGSVVTTNLGKTGVVAL